VSNAARDIIPRLEHDVPNQPSAERADRISDVRARYQLVGIVNKCGGSLCRRQGRALSTRHISRNDLIFGGVFILVVECLGGRPSFAEPDEARDLFEQQTRAPAGGGKMRQAASKATIWEIRMGSLARTAGAAVLVLGAGTAGVGQASALLLDAAPIVRCGPYHCWRQIS
jgi:hypothetical protein